MNKYIRNGMISILACCVCGAVSSCGQEDKVDLSELRALAKEGDTEAQTSLGVCYLSGEGCSQDAGMAVEWFRKAAEKGDKKAQFMLGSCYGGGVGVALDWEKEVEWLLKAARQGHLKAQYNLSTNYLLGLGVKKDVEAGRYWLRKAAEEGFQPAIDKLENDSESLAVENNEAKEKTAEENYRKANEYWREGNKDGAFPYYRKAAEQGHWGAQKTLGFFYEEGRGVTKDEQQAVYWYRKAAEQIRKAAEQGNRVAQKDLGDYYDIGWGCGVVEKDIEQAVYWWRKAAEQGEAGAQKELASCYLIGQRVQLDLKQAAYWYRKAAEQGNRSACYTLGRMYYEGIGVEQDYNQAVYWYRKAAEQGNRDRSELRICGMWFKEQEQGLIRAQKKLGFCYLTGQGVQQDLEQAAYWYRKAAEQGDQQAINALKRMEK